MSSEKRSITEVHVDGLVLLKIIQHFSEEMSLEFSNAHGVILGFPCDNVLKITNCYPFISDSSAKAQYQHDILIHMHDAKVEDFQIGTYMPSHLDSFISENFLKNMFLYQVEVEESVALIYDYLKTSEGVLAFRAMRLTDKGLEIFKQKTITNDSLSKHNIFKKGLNEKNLVEEIPVYVTNSTLTQMMLCECKLISNKQNRLLDTKLKYVTSENFLNQKIVGSIVECIDEIGQDASSVQNHIKKNQRQQVLLESLKSKKMAENEQRKLKGEPCLPIDDNLMNIVPLNQLSRNNFVSFTCQSNFLLSRLHNMAKFSTNKFKFGESIIEKLAD